MTETQVLITVVVAVLALAGSIGTAVLTARQKGLTDLVAALQTEVQALHGVARDNGGRIEKLESRDRAWADYVHVLRLHIYEQQPPPPPPWPPRLDR